MSSNSQIRITPEQMDARAVEYRRERDSVDGVIKNMDALINALREEWEGNKSEEFIQAYGELRPSFVKAYELIEKFAQTLNDTAEGFRVADGQ